MARYDVYRDPRGSDNLLVCIQSEVFEVIDTRMAIPLLPEHPHRTPLKKLNPVIVVAGNVAENRDEITAALDLLFQGF
ncbi:CcdB family protein [Mesorhizobium sp. YIM 152430]|uniref:CcdB family protein n=1 Tax=Mesorhizobium sp. YIM 152430 TaxID=3031761 RepID=UPI0023DACE44|nr:CcdB family protein [Mesorhizobium sp. YIM 152430]MDF1600569.1 CcdB family protein [Mesorhizobium sp. YIM 152430]